MLGCDFYIPKTKAETITLLLEMGIKFSKTELRKKKINQLRGIYCDKIRRARVG